MAPKTRFNHANSGIFPKVMPGHRMQSMVATKFIPVPILPIPDNNSVRVQKSVLCPSEKRGM